MCIYLSLFKNYLRRKTLCPLYQCILTDTYIRRTHMYMYNMYRYILIKGIVLMSNVHVREYIRRHVNCTTCIYTGKTH